MSIIGTTIELQGFYGPTGIKHPSRVGWCTQTFNLYNLRRAQDMYEYFVENQPEELQKHYRFVSAHRTVVEYAYKERQEPGVFYEFQVFRGFWDNLGGYSEMTLEEALRWTRKDVVTSMGAKWRLVRITRKVLEQKLLIRDNAKYGPRKMAARMSRLTQHTGSRFTPRYRTLPPQQRMVR